MMAKIFYTRAQRIKRARKALFTRRYDGTTQAISNDINRMIMGGLQRKETQSATASRIADKHPNVDYTQARRIVRNETHSVQSVMREIQFHESDPIGSAKYVWQTTPDKRRTPICKKIAERTKKGVTLDQLRAIISEEADVKTYDPIKKPWTPHIGCRSLARRIFT